MSQQLLLNQRLWHIFYSSIKSHSGSTAVSPHISPASSVASPSILFRWKMEHHVMRISEDTWLVNNDYYTTRMTHHTPTNNPTSNTRASNWRASNSFAMNFLRLADEVRDKDAAISFLQHYELLHTNRRCSNGGWSRRNFIANELLARELLARVLLFWLFVGVWWVVLVV